jgi:rRNA maturation protein Nop10
MNLKKCPACNAYTLKEEHCKKPTKDAHHKFIKIRDVKERIGKEDKSE